MHSVALYIWFLIHKIQLGMEAYGYQCNRQVANAAKHSRTLLRGVLYMERKIGINY